MSEISSSEGQLQEQQNWKEPGTEASETKGFMEWTGNNKIFRALIPAIGLSSFLLGASRSEAATKNNAIEHLKLEKGIEMHVRASAIEQFCPESVKKEVINGVEHKRIEANVKLGDHLCDLYLASPINKGQMGKWDHIEKSQEIYKNLKSDLEKQYPKKESTLKKVFDVVSKHITTAFGDPSKKESRQEINGIPIEDATLKNLIDAIKIDDLKIYDSLKGQENQNIIFELMQTAEKAEMAATEEAVAYSIESSQSPEQ